MILWVAVAAASVLMITFLVISGITLCAFFLARIFAMLLADEGPAMSRDVRGPLRRVRLE